MGFSMQDYWVGCHFLLQGIFPIYELNLGILHFRQSLSQMSYKGIILLIFIIFIWYFIIILLLFNIVKYFYYYYSHIPQGNFRSLEKWRVASYDKKKIKVDYCPFTEHLQVVLCQAFEHCAFDVRNRPCFQVVCGKLERVSTGPNSIT